LIACAKPNELDVLQAEATSVALEQQPALDALAARITALKRDMGHNLPGWETMIQYAHLANDELGLWPFTQAVPPGPGWQPSPATLLGIGPYVRTKAPELAKAGKTEELRFLVADERKRYAEGIQSVKEHLEQVEQWIATRR
jgi:hypothetical protein